MLDPFWNVALADAGAMFLSWVDVFYREFARAHPASAVEQVAALIRQDFQRQWSLERLAGKFHLTPSRLRRAFHREFGVSIHDYQKTRRVIEALHQVPDGKIEAIALEVGYRSKKDFYRAFHEVTGMTPTTFRRLSHEGAYHVVQSVGGAARRAATAADRHRTARRKRLP